MEQMDHKMAVLDRGVGSAQSRTRLLESLTTDPFVWGRAAQIGGMIMLTEARGMLVVQWSAQYK